MSDRNTIHESFADIYRFIDIMNNNFLTAAMITAMYKETEDESYLLLAKGRLSRTYIPRVRGSIEEIFQRLGPVHFRRSHRMSYDDFKVLAAAVVPYIEYSKCLQGRNGPVPLTLALSATLRFLAGGSVYDIMITHGVSHSTFYNCVWHTLAAINACPLLKLTFPSTSEEQLMVAKAFADKSKAGFDCCVGCIDGMLLWTEKPNKADCCNMKTALQAKGFQ